MDDSPPGTAPIAVAQAVYYVVTGLWPLIHMRSFEWLTGPKVDRWLVKTVGALLGVIGGAIGLAARRDAVTREMALLGAGTAAVLTGVDVVYASQGRIRKIYLLDALGEAVIFTIWLLSWPRARDERPR